MLTFRQREGLDNLIAAEFRAYTTMDVDRFTVKDVQAIFRAGYAAFHASLPWPVIADRVKASVIASINAVRFTRPVAA